MSLSILNDIDFQSIRLKLLFFTCIILGICSCHQEENQNISKNKFSKLDGLNVVPEWLLLEVEYALPNEGLNVWVPTEDFQTSSLLRIPRFPTTSDGINPIHDGHLIKFEAIRNEQVSAQIAIASTENLTNLQIIVDDLWSSNDSVIKAENVQVRFVKFIPVHEAHIGAKYKEMNPEGVSGFKAPDVVGDPLVETSQVDVPKLRVQPTWFTFRIPENTQPGTYKGVVEVRTDQNEPIQLNLNLQVHNYVIPAPKNFEFNLDIWLNPFAVADFNNVEAWSNEHWEHLKPYFKDLASRGQKNITAIIVEKPWKIPWLHDEFRSQTESPYESMVKWIYHPDGSWSFDYSIFDKYVQFALANGHGPNITAYSMLAFRGSERITYFDMSRDEMVEEQIDVMDDRYEEVWSFFLNDFRSHLKEKVWFEDIYLAFDERPGELMNRVISIIRKSAPEFEEKIYLSGGEDNPDIAEWNVSYEVLFDHGVQEAVTNRSTRGLPVRFGQTCCSGPHPNRFTFSPASEIQMIAWLIMKYNFTGYVDWAYNSWPKDIFNYPVYIYPQGDEYFVYPSLDGPMSSIRWELLLEGIEDFELANVLLDKGSLNQEQFNEAIKFATRNATSGSKDPNDIIKARKILLQAAK